MMAISRFSLLLHADDGMMTYSFIVSTTIISVLMMMRQKGEVKRKIIWCAINAVKKVRQKGHFLYHVS